MVKFNSLQTSVNIYYDFSNSRYQIAKIFLKNNFQLAFKINTRVIN